MAAEKNKSPRDGVRAAAVFEAAKGVVVLMAGSGLLMLIHRDIHTIAEQFVVNLHFNPAKHYPRIFLDAVRHLTDIQLWMLSLSAMVYSMVRFAEACGLWFRKVWAEWFGFLTGAIYVPVEIYELLQGVNWIKLTILIVNLGVIGILGIALYRRFRLRPGESK